jgi:hypothetical protein
MSAVNYKQATQVAIGAIAVAAFSPVSIGSGICAVATTSIGYFGVEALDKIREGFIKGLDKARYSIMEIPSSIHSPKLGMCDINKIDARFEQVVQRFYKTMSEGDTDNQISSVRKKRLDSDKKELLNSLKYGCCYGAVSTLFNDIEKNGLSIEQSALGLNKNEAYFRQIIQAYGLCLTRWLESETESIQRHEQELKDLQIQKCRIILQETLSSSSSTSTINQNAEINDLDEESSDEEIKEQMLRELIDEEKQTLKKFEKERALLKKLDPLYSSILKSQLFAPNCAPQTYRYVFEKMLKRKSMPKDAIIRGIIRIPAHTIGFQFAPKEYYVYDTYMGVLLKFTDQELCFTKVRTYVLQALETVQKAMPSEVPQNPKINFEITHWKA